MPSSGLDIPLLDPAFFPDEDKPGHHHHHHHHHHPPPKHHGASPKDKRYITILSKRHRPHEDMTFLLGDGQVKPTQGFGGWQELARPKGRAASDWPGAPAVKWDIPIVVWREKFPRRPPVQVGHKVRRVLELGRPHHRGEPPVFRIYGKALPSVINGELFVMENIEWGDSEAQGDGDPKLQSLILHVILYDREDLLKIRRRKRHHKPGHGGHHHHHKVKEKETLMSIAADEYGDYTMWTEIADINNIKNPRNLELGSDLIIP
jgi:hypothetical protein